MESPTAKSANATFANLSVSPTLASNPLAGNPLASQPLARFSICAGQPRYQRGKAAIGTPAIGQIFPWLAAQLARTRSADPVHPRSPNQPPDALPFTGGWLGWLGYDAAWEIERLPWENPDLLPFPVAFWYEPECFAIADHQTQMLWLAATEPEQLTDLTQTWEAIGLQPLGLQAVTSVSASVLQTVSTHEPQRLPQFVTPQASYEAIVRQAQAHIRAGDIFQANLSLRFQTTSAASGWDIYQALHQINPSPFASYWKTPWGEVLSCSPERLVQLCGRTAQTRPIAGTRPRGTSLEEDLVLEQALLGNRKENAEHIMLVDLERNDLGRVCRWGSVVVDELMAIERYSHVMHLVSNVAGELQTGYDAIDLMRSLFPGGTITGCPKVRCMEIIENLEPVRRSLFYGSCGYLDRRGNLDLNILIRTLLKVGDTVWGQVGAGIVADSDPTREWFESLSKAKAQLAAIDRF